MVASLQALRQQLILLFVSLDMTSETHTQKHKVKYDLILAKK